MKEGYKNLIMFLVGVLLLLFAIWFVRAHSEFVSFRDLIVFIGAIIGIFTFVLNAHTSKTDSRLDRLEKNLDELAKDTVKIKEDVAHIKGKIG